MSQAVEAATGDARVLLALQPEPQTRRMLQITLAISRAEVVASLARLADAGLVSQWRLWGALFFQLTDAGLAAAINLHRGSDGDVSDAST